MEPVNDKVLKFGPVLFVPPPLPKKTPNASLYCHDTENRKSLAIAGGRKRKLRGQDTDCVSSSGDGGTLLLEVCLFLSVFKGTPTQQSAQN